MERATGYIWWFVGLGSLAFFFVHASIDLLDLQEEYSICVIEKKRKKNVLKEDHGIRWIRGKMAVFRSHLPELQSSAQKKLFARFKFYYHRWKGLELLYRLEKNYLILKRFA